MLTSAGGGRGCVYTLLCFITDIPSLVQFVSETWGKEVCCISSPFLPFFLPSSLLQSLLFFLYSFLSSVLSFCPCHRLHLSLFVSVSPGSTVSDVTSCLLKTGIPGIWKKRWNSWSAFCLDPGRPSSEELSSINLYMKNLLRGFTIHARRTIFECFLLYCCVHTWVDSLPKLHSLRR